MSVVASCPHCSKTSEVREELVGQKVRCKRCQTKFVVAENAKAAKRSGSKGTLTPSGGVRRPKKSNAKTWVVLSVVTVLFLGVGGAGLWFAALQEPAKPAKAKSARRDDSSKEAAAADKKLAKANDVKNASPVDIPEPRANKTAQAVGAKAQPVGEIKMTEPVTVAALSAWTPLEIPDLSVIKAILPLAKQPNRVGLHTVEGGKHFFELYDLKKQERLAKVPLADNVELLDVDPDGTHLAAATKDNHIDVYTLPEGGLVADDWRPYSTIKDQERFLSGGKIAQIAMLSKDLCWTITSLGHGDLWELPSQKLTYRFPLPAREDFLKPDVRANRDFVLSPDRALFAFATDDGIQFFDAKTKAKSGTTPKLTKYGTKPEMIGMGFEPEGTKLGVYFSAQKETGRTYYQARFSVPVGEELMLEAVLDPGDFSGVEFVNGEFFLSFDRNRATLRDGKGKTTATCSIPGRGSRFAPKVVQSNVAFAFVNEKNKPALGLVRVPVSEVSVPVPVVSSKGKTLSEILGDTPPPPEPTKQRDIDRQEIWEFGSKGIVRKGTKSIER